jgi:hypothetical protein
MPPVSLIKSISAGPLEKKSSFPCSVWLFWGEWWRPCGPDTVLTNSSLLNTDVPNKYTYFGTQQTVHNFESLTGLLEIRHCTETKATLYFSQLWKLSELSTPILSRISLRELHISSRAFNSASGAWKKLNIYTFVLKSNLLSIFVFICCLLL